MQLWKKWVRFLCLFQDPCYDKVFIDLDGQNENYIGFYLYTIFNLSSKKNIHHSSPYKDLRNTYIILKTSDSDSQSHWPENLQRLD